MPIRFTVNGKESRRRWILIRLRRGRWQYVHGSTTDLDHANRVASLFDGLVVSIFEFNQMSREGWL